MNIKKLNEFNLLKEEVEKFGKVLVHLIQFLKDPNDACEFIIALLPLNVSTEEMYHIICS